MLKNTNEPFYINNDQDNKNHNQSTDLLLWKAFKSGDEGAFIKIYQDYIDILYNQGKQFTYDHDLVKDCLQDFFINLRQSRGKLSDTDNIKLYLLKSFRRRVVATLKKNAKYFVGDASFNEQIFPVELSYDQKLINAQYQEDQLDRLNKGLKKLPVKDREALYYYFYQNLSYQEIADIYSYDHISSARRLIYNSLKRLKGLLSILFCFILNY